jgi:xylulokinase
VILTVDAGTSVTKVALWDQGGLVAMGGTAIDTVHPAPGWSEQDPSHWWSSVVDACAQVREQSPGGLESVEAVACTGARQTFALVDGTGDPMGPGIVWSDRRAGVEAEALADAPGAGNGSSTRTGIVIDAASMAAKIAWLVAHQPQTVDASAWVLAPRDLIAWRLTGIVATDVTLASRTGLYDADGQLADDLAGLARSKLPPVVPSDRVTGHLEAAAAAALGMPVGVPVVIGAGDRPCEVLGSGATESRPMVSWGTTANVSLPVGAPPAQPPPGAVVSRAADGRWLLEGGVSAAGSFLAWLGVLTGRSPGQLASLALDSPPGARGVWATPWLEGARAPWWQPEAAAAFVGLASAHEPADLARAAFESVAWEVERCLEVFASRYPAGRPVTGLVLGGSGATVPVWLEVLAGITGLEVTGRRSGQAASAGAAMLAAAAVGLDYDLDRIDPLDTRLEPRPSAVRRYAELRGQAEQVAKAVVGLARPPRSATPRPGNGPREPSCG